MKKKRLLLLAATPWLFAIMLNADVRVPDQESAASDCLALYEEAGRLLQKFQQAGEEVSPRVRGFELSKQAAQACDRASKQASESNEAAQLAALSFLSRARLISGHKSDPIRRRDLLAEGIETVSGLDHDRSPALYEILRQSAIVEWDISPERGIALMSRAAEIAETSFGPGDPRLAECLSDLGFMHAPTVHPGSKPKGHADPERAEELYRRSLEIWTHMDSPSSYPAFSATVVYLRDLMKSQGRVDEAKTLDDSRVDIYAAEQRLLKTKRDQDL